MVVPSSSPIEFRDSQFIERSTALAPVTPDSTPIGSYRGAARTFAQLCRAFALVHDRYLEQGYMRQHESGMRYSLLNLLPQTTTFVVEEQSKLLGTLSVVIDSPAGLPASDDFAQEIAERRKLGRVIAEATMFSCLPDPKFQTQVSLQLMSLAFAWCVEIGIDDLCLAVSPKHAPFYEKVLGFERLGRERAVNHVEGNAGIFLLCNIAAVLDGEGQITRQGARLLLASKEHGPLAFNRLSLLEVEVATLLDFCPELLLQGEPARREAVERCYPTACAVVEENYGRVVSLEGLIP